MSNAGKSRSDASGGTGIAPVVTEDASVTIRMT